MIVYTCLAFYHIRDAWDTANISEECCVDGDLVTKTMEITGATVSLKDQEISTGIHEYKFKIISYNKTGHHYWDIGIGIVSSKGDEDESESFRSTSYNYTTSKGEVTGPAGDNDYGVKCKPDDIVTMIVDLNNYQIRYTVNDQDLGVAFDNIQQTIYKIEVYLYGKGSKVQLLHW